MSASVCTAVRSRPMVAAAPMPCPTTSPMTRPTRAPDSGITSNQSPPTPSFASAGRYDDATSSAVPPRSVCGSRLRWSTSAAVCSRV